MIGDSFLRTIIKRRIAGRKKRGRPRIMLLDCMDDERRLGPQQVEGENWTSY